MILDTVRTGTARMAPTTPASSPRKTRNRMLRSGFSCTVRL